MSRVNVIAAFTEDDAERLTGISRRRLRYWDDTAFFSPSLADENRRLTHSRIYTFRDLVCLRVLRQLRDDGGVPLQHLRDVKSRLAHMGDDVWAATELYVLKRRVHFRNPESKKLEDILNGQGVLAIPLKVVSEDMTQKVRSLWTRPKNATGKIERQRGVAGRAAVFAGTRIPVSAVQAFADEGYNVEQIRAEYPSLSEEDIKAALKQGRAA
ncbi:MAG: DUF433 domain-containing protein [Pseudomonadota bacterium]|nr:DUF433 domain-containing protein [Pseudomonadota bacterium]